MNPIARNLSFLAIYAVYGLTFLLAGGSKFKEKKVPDWFRNQFESSLMAKFPGISVSYWSIALLEILVPCILVVSLLKMEFAVGANHFFLQIAISLASLIFAMLGFGLRLVGDFQGAANLFFYFTGTLITQIFIGTAYLC